MTGRNPNAAIAGFQHRHQRVLSCVTRQNQLGAVGSAGHRYIMRPPAGSYAPVRHALITHFWYRADIVLIDTGRSGNDRWAVDITKYILRFDVQGGQELLAFHWHPEVPGRPGPHIHLGPASQAVGLLRESHIPASNISLEEVLAYAIRELHVEPVREDWPAVLAEGAE